MLSPASSGLTRALAILILSCAIANAAEPPPDTLPGTAPLTLTGNLSVLMHDAAEREMDRRIAAARDQRAKYWHRDTSSADAYEKSIQGNREHFKKIIGIVDPRVPVRMERFGDDEHPELVADAHSFSVHRVRWTVLEGVTGEGLLLEPKAASRGHIIALPDADQTPEEFAGLSGAKTEATVRVQSLAANAYTVLVPALIDRATAASGNPSIQMTNEPHREWLHRQAYMMGRTLIGYEVQKVMAAVDWMQNQKGDAAKHIGVAGYGEGGLIAFYAAAVDPRIHAAYIDGYFKSREQTWHEPLYRNVWGLLREFGDAEIATLIAPRALVVQPSPEPDVTGPPPVGAGQKKCAAPGWLRDPNQTPEQSFDADLESARGEFARLETLVPGGLMPHAFVDPKRPQTSTVALNQFAKFLGADRPLAGPPFESKPGDSTPPSPASADEAVLRGTSDAPARQLRQVKEIEAHVQNLVRVSDRTRDEFFLFKAAPEFKDQKWTYAQFPSIPPAPFIEAAKPYREMFWREVIGRIEDPLPPPNPRTRKVYDLPKWTGYDVVLDTVGESFTWGVLLLPRDLQPGEMRPVVVCQHGRRGMPADVIDQRKEAYHDFATRLVEQGYIVLAPHNLYGQEPQYRTISRKGNTVGLSMFSLILRHHEQWLAFLKSLPSVDPARIGFYGLSYGGESAVRIPSLLEGYALSICSGDFNDWTRKVASTDDRHSFMFSEEWEMPYFNMGSTFSYAELTYLIFPRPFMVERGHHDGVAPDSWVAYEYAKTRWLYAQYGLADRTRIEFFNGGHTINGQGTFEFLHEHLKWPGRE